MSGWRRRLLLIGCGYPPPESECCAFASPRRHAAARENRYRGPSGDVGWPGRSTTEWQRSGTRDGDASLLYRLFEPTTRDMFERLLIAVDGSDCATRAARVGVAVAAAYGATVDAVAAAHDELDADDAERVLADVEVIGEDAGVTVESHSISGTCSAFGIA